MKHLGLIVICAILGHSTALAQSGRRSTKPPPTPPPPVVDEPKERPDNPPARDRPQVVAVPNEEYKCVDDGSLTVVLPSSETEKVFAPNEVTIKAKLLSRPKPEYTAEARRNAVEGSITVQVVVLKNGTVSTVKISGRGGPFGLNESAIHAACKMEFAPASKDGERVAQWFKTEIAFRLGSSIGR